MRTFEVSRRGGSGVDVGGGPLWPPAVACLIGSLCKKLTDTSHIFHPLDNPPLILLG